MSSINRLYIILMESQCFAIVYVEKVVFPQMPLNGDVNLSYLIIDRCKKGLGFSRSSEKVESKLESLTPQNEAFFQSRWNFYSGEVTYSINDWLVAWPTAFRLEVLRRVQDWEILN